MTWKSGIERQVNEWWSSRDLPPQLVGLGAELAPVAGHL